MSDTWNSGRRPDRHVKAVARSRGQVTALVNRRGHQSDRKVWRRLFSKVGRQLDAMEVRKRIIEG